MLRPGPFAMVVIERGSPFGPGVINLRKKEDIMTSDAKKIPAGGTVDTAEPTPAVETRTQQFDWAEINARLERQREEARARLKVERAELLALLRGRNVEEIEACYDGYADSGNVGEITVNPAGLGIPDIEERLKDFVWGVAYNLHPGFEINDGGEGTVTWDVVKDRIDVDHADFYTARNEHLHEDI